MKDFVVNNETKSHEMVRYWMIHVNQMMCLEIKRLFRCNPEPQANKLELLKEYLKFKNQEDFNDEINTRDDIVSLSYKYTHNDTLLQYIIKSLLIKAYYTDNDDSHYGIGISNYTHWTSPIRRSSDLVNHCLLKGYEIDVKKYLNEMNESELKQDMVEHFIESYNNFKIAGNCQGIRRANSFEPTAK